MGSGSLEGARKAAGYLSKYVGKSFDEERVPGLHRYEVAEGFQPVAVRIHGRNADGVVDEASEMMGRAPTTVWSSGQEQHWRGPPAVWASWAG